MGSSRTTGFRGLVALVGAVALALSSAGVANASHFRGSEANFSVSGDAATWVIESAWRTNDGSVFVGGVGSSVEITELSGPADAPGTGAGTGSMLTVTSSDLDSSFDLYDLATEVIEGDLSALGDGLYEVYLEGCCRIDGIQNGGEDFSQWIRFTKTGSTYDLAPTFNAATVYATLASNAETVFDFSASDSSAVTYSLAAVGAPEFGATQLPCSTMTNGILRVGPTHCTGGDVYTDIYLAGTAWVAKIVATDAQGNASVTDTLLRVLTPPEPHIDSHEFLGNGTSVAFDVYVEDTIVDQWTVTCIGIGDATDIVTGISSTSPVAIHGFTVGESYTCEVTAENEAGSGTSVDAYEIGPIVLNGVAIVTDLAVGDRLAGSVVQLLGSNLVPSSAFTLEQLPEPGELTSGTADILGGFDVPFEIPSSACVVGASSLVLTGEGPNGPVTDTVWFELDANCIVVQISRIGPVTVTPKPAAVLPATGAEVSSTATIAALNLLLAGVILMTIRGRRQSATLR